MRKCKHCSAEIPTASKSVTVPHKKKFCDYDCMAEWGDIEGKRRNKAKAERERAKNEEWKKSLPKNTKELNRRNLKWQEDHTQTAFNRMRVQQELLWYYEHNLEPVCISCQKPKMDWCCSHNKTRGSNSYLQFDERNTHLACNTYCNKSLSGNINGNSTSIGYLAGLRLRFGEEVGQSIIDYCDSAPTVAKRTCEEFEELRKGFNAEYRRLKPLVDTAKTLFESIQGN